MQAAHANPGDRFKEEIRRAYQQKLVDLLFANQVANSGSFSDDDPCTKGWVVSGGTFLTVTGILMLLLMVFLLVIYSLRRTGRQLIRENERLRRRTFPTAPPQTSTTAVNTLRTSSIRTISNGSSSQTFTTTTFTSELPRYESLRPSFNRAILAQAAPVEITEHDDTENDDANNADESDVEHEECLRPYPLMQFPGCGIKVIEPPHIVDRPL